VDRTIVERAVRALAALNTGGGAIEVRSAPASLRPPVTHAENGEENAACGSPFCNGCYVVDLVTSAKIHPPKCGENYRAWLELWAAKGKVQ
jgi:hypothetical protein